LSFKDALQNNLKCCVICYNHGQDIGTDRDSVSFAISRLEWKTVLGLFGGWSEGSSSGSVSQVVLTTHISR